MTERSRRPYADEGFGDELHQVNSFGRFSNRHMVNKKRNSRTEPRLVQLHSMSVRTHQADPRHVADRLLDNAALRLASDIHLDPDAEGYQVRLRVDGLLQDAERLDSELGRGVVTRLMVQAQLLTYRRDIPQEGRLTVAAPSLGRTMQMRLAIMPTTQGLRAVVRLPAELRQPRTLEELDLPDAATEGLRRFAAAETGMLLVTGPAGSGKTTTIYALLEHLTRTQSGQSVVALEDPVERELPRVTQVQVRPMGDLTYATALRSILRQDPQVLMLGEVRDAETASLAVQAALSGHRLIATLHAGSPATAIARLSEMGLAAHQLAGALWGVMSQRLLRRGSREAGYAGRLPVAELADIDEPVRQRILETTDAATLTEHLQKRPGYQTMTEAAEQAVRDGRTDRAELRRVLGG